MTSVQLPFLSFRAALWVVLSIGALAFTVRAEDKVTISRNNEVLTGEVKKDDMDGVAVNNKGAERTVTAAEVVDIDWDINNENWRDGIGAFKRGNFADAARDLMVLAGDKDALNKIRPAARPYLLYAAAESLFRSGKAADAKPMLEAFVAEQKASRYLPLAVASLVEAAIQTKDYKSVGGLLSQLRGLGGDQKQLADLFEGQLLFSQDKVKEAESKFAAASTGIVPQVKAQALVGQARCLVEGKNSSRAKDLATQALTISTDAKVASTAHLVIGDAIMLDIDEKKLAGPALEGALLDAINEYMRVQIQYPSDGRSEAHAILRTGECFQRLSKLPNRGTDKDRALAMYGKLQESRFKGSSYANEAAKNMQAMR